MAIGPERAVGTGPIGEGPIGPLPEEAQVTFGWHQPFTPAARRVVVRGVIAAGLVLCPLPPPVAPSGWHQPLSTAVARPSVANALYTPFVPEEATVENTTNVVWPLTQGEKARPTERPAAQGYHLFVPAEATLDNTTNRVWPLQTQSEKARPIERIAPQGHHLFVPEEAVVENTTNTVWPLTQRLEAAPRPSVRHTQPISAYAPVVEDNTVTIDKWQQPLGMHAVPVPRVAPAGGAPFVPEEAVLENTVDQGWRVPLSEPVAARPVWVTQPFYGFPYEGVDNTRTEWDWTIQWPSAVDIPRPAPVGGAPFVPAEATVQNTTNVVWPLTQGQIARPIVRAPLGATPFVPRAAVIDNTVEPDKWMQRWQGPPRYQPNRGPFQPFVPSEATVDNTTNRVWPLAFGEKARPLARVAPQGVWTLGYPYVAESNTRTEWDWYIQWPERAPRYWWKAKPYQPFVPREAVLDNTVTPDKWQQQFSRQLKRRWPVKPYVTYVQVEVAPPVVTVTPDQWIVRWKGPPRLRPFRTQPTYVPPFVAEDNTVTPDKWLLRWKGPPRVWPRWRPPTMRFGRFVETFQQSIDAEITLTVEFHICGWGTATEATEGFVVESEQTDTWSEQTEQVASVSEQSEQSDTWSEQTESDDDYDEQDECGR